MGREMRLERLTVKVNFKQVLMQVLEPEKPMLEGAPPEPGDDESRQPLDLRSVTVNALMAFDPQAKMSGEEKVRRYDLGMRIVKGGEDDDYKTEEVALMKKLVGELYAPAIVGQTDKMLEGQTDEKEKVAGSVPAQE